MGVSAISWSQALHKRDWVRGYHKLKHGGLNTSVYGKTHPEFDVVQERQHRVQIQLRCPSIGSVYPAPYLRPQVLQFVTPVRDSGRLDKGEGHQQGPAHHAEDSRGVVQGVVLGVEVGGDLDCVQVDQCCVSEREREGGREGEREY